MTTLTVWSFPDPTEAERAEKALKQAASEGLVKIDDHAVVVWPEGEDKPRIDHGHDSPKRGAAWGALWGFLGGALLTVPVVGIAAGVTIGLVSKATEGTGLTKKDLERIKDEIKPGTSALFLVTEGADLDRLG